MNDANVNVDVNANATIDGSVNNNEALDINLGETQQIDVSFSNGTENLSVDLSGDGNITIELGNIYDLGSCKVVYNTTAFWNSYPDLVAKKGYIYIYSDYMQSGGQNIAGFKVGDGTSYLIDMPFTDKISMEHIQNNTIHITQEEREFWNNKVRCYIDPLNAHGVIFTTH